MASFQLSNINFWAVFVAWVVHIILNLIWFQAKLFGNQWSKLTGKELKPASKWLIPGLLGHLAMVLVLAILINLTNSHGSISGVIMGLVTWIGFIVPMEIGELVWEKIPFKLFLIRIGNQFVSIAIVGYILGTWQ